MSASGGDEVLAHDAMAEMDQVLDRSPAERAQYLDLLARTRPHVHAMVIGLLKHVSAVNSGFMEPAPRTHGSLHPDSRLGPYRIIRLLGEGGMGEVWLASRDDGLYQGQVAIKTLHPYFAGGALRERFLREAQVLGRLTHSNIARILDAGVHDGIVYLVLEYVVGRPIDIACDEERLNVSARLGIFLHLCAAVAHAHSSLVVHRDIKPGNVLLTADGVPKLLDFGIASFFEPEKAGLPSDVTRVTGRIFTPEYAAPEQVLGKEITTATDVYSLGVLLHALLTGQLPYGKVEGERPQWEHAVLHVEPQRMTQTVDFADHQALSASRSTSFARLRRELGGDLENIVQKALKKNPEERYFTVAAFADDVRRHLHGEPVAARPASSWYRLGKFARRNRLAVGAAAMVVLALGVGLAVSLWQLQVARSERMHAEEVTEFVASIFRSADPFFTGKSEMSAADLLALAHQRIDEELQSKPQTAVELLNIVGQSQVEIEKYADAEATLNKAIAIAGRMVPPDEMGIAEARAELYMIAVNKPDAKAAQVLLDQALPVLRKHQPRSARQYATLLQTSAYQASEEGKPKEAIARCREAVAVTNAVLGPQNSETVQSKRNLALYLVLDRQYTEAKPLLEQTLRDARAMSPSGERLGLLEQSESTYARLLLDSGDLAAGIEHLDIAIDLGLKAFGPRSLAVTSLRSQLMRAQARLGDLNKAIVTAQLTYDMLEPGQAAARSLTNLGRFTLMARRVPESLDLLRRAIDHEEKYDPGKGSWLPVAQSEYGKALALSGRFADATRVLEAGLLNARESTTGGAQVSALNSLGLLHQLQLQWAGSERDFREALEQTSAADLNQKHRADAMMGIAVARLELGHAEEAEKWLRQADEAARVTFVNLTPLRADIAMYLGRALLVQKKMAEARESFATANAYWQEFDAKNRSAGEAAYATAQGHQAAGDRPQARAEFTRAVAILTKSPLPGDVRLVQNARQELRQ